MSYLCDQFFIIIFIFIATNHIISLKQTHFLLDTFVKISAAGCSIDFANFLAGLSLVLFIKVLLKKSVYL